MTEEDSLWQYFQCAVITAAALEYISYPAMALAKSHKLVLVMLMNVVLYRRKSPPHKYLVVTLVTLSITSPMFFGNKKKGHKTSEVTNASASGWIQLIGVGYLLANPLLDGFVNNIQDQIFQNLEPTGQQTMLHTNLFSTLTSPAVGVLPFPHIPVVHPTDAGGLELLYAVNFLKTHPDDSQSSALWANCSSSRPYSTSVP